MHKFWNKRYFTYYYVKNRFCITWPIFWGYYNGICDHLRLKSSMKELASLTYPFRGRSEKVRSEGPNSILGRELHFDKVRKVESRKYYFIPSGSGSTNETSPSHLHSYASITFATTHRQYQSEIQPNLAHHGRGGRVRGPQWTLNCNECAKLPLWCIPGSLHRSNGRLSGSSNTVSAWCWFDELVIWESCIYW